MLGAIYGDKAGSIYEYGQLKKISSIDPENLIMSESFYSDDTIETVALIDAIINSSDYEDTLRKYILENIDYKPDYQPYFKTSFSPGTIKWALGNGRCDSIGNGALMRISPVGYLFDTEDEIIENAYLATKVSHNSLEAIESATIIALMIYYFRCGLTKKEVFNKMGLFASYDAFLKFNTTCRETLNNCLFAIYKSNSFEDAIRKTLLMGGDTDTNCCIVGSVAEALYGMSQSQANESLMELPNSYVKLLKRTYKVK